MWNDATVGEDFSGKACLPLALWIALCLTGCAAQRGPGAAPAKAAAAVPAPAPAASASDAALPSELGIRVTALRLTAAGFMLDLRYRVVDPDRAKTLLDRRVPAFLVDEATGVRLGVPDTPKLGRLRPGTLNNIRTDREYGMLFGNPGVFLKAGAKVTLIAGNAQVPALTVQ